MALCWCGCCLTHLNGKCCAFRVGPAVCLPFSGVSSDGVDSGGLIAGRRVLAPVFKASMEVLSNRWVTSVWAVPEEVESVAVELCVGASPALFGRRWGARCAADGFLSKADVNSGSVVGVVDGQWFGCCFVVGCFCTVAVVGKVVWVDSLEFECFVVLSCCLVLRAESADVECIRLV